VYVGVDFKIELLNKAITKSNIRKNLAQKENIIAVRQKYRNKE